MEQIAKEAELHKQEADEVMRKMWAALGAAASGLSAFLDSVAIGVAKGGFWAAVLIFLAWEMSEVGELKMEQNISVLEWLLGFINNGTVGPEKDASQYQVDLYKKYLAQLNAMVVNAKIDFSQEFVTAAAKVHKGIVGLEIEIENELKLLMDPKAFIDNALKAGKTREDAQSEYQNKLDNYKLLVKQLNVLGQMKVLLEEFIREKKDEKKKAGSTGSNKKWIASLAEETGDNSLFSPKKTKISKYGRQDINSVYALAVAGANEKCNSESLQFPVYASYRTPSDFKKGKFTISENASVAQLQKLLGTHLTYQALTFSGADAKGALCWVKTKDFPTKASLYAYLNLSKQNKIPTAAALWVNYFAHMFKSIKINSVSAIKCTSIPAY